MEKKCCNEITVYGSWVKCMWKNLVLRYWKDPNYHDKIIWSFLVDGFEGVYLKEFTQREIVYLTLTSVLKRKETRFHNDSLWYKFDPFLKQNWDHDQLYLFRRFVDPRWFQRYVNTTFYVFDVVDGKEVNAPIKYSNCIFHKPQLFRRHHRQREPLSIEGCKDINS
jgi:hypothetical protein